MYKNFLKRIIDILISGVGLLCTLPIMLIVAGLLAYYQNGKVFFRQQRPGYKGRPFFIYKFKTMTDERDAKGNLLPDEKRLTWIGKFVRSTSLDELPQFWNVLIGEMSFIGPRPLLMEYIPLYSPEQSRRHDVRPGITGWAQVNGRNAVDWDERFRLDVEYVDNLSLAFDMKVIWKSVKTVLFREGISSKTSVTMEKFAGSKKVANG
jgi:sugar transferase EpsL